jgi:hypothetical protein
MAEGVFNFCQALIGGEKEATEEKGERERGWQTVAMDTCTLVLSEVE